MFGSKSHLAVRSFWKSYKICLIMHVSSYLIVYALVLRKEASCEPFSNMHAHSNRRLVNLVKWCHLHIWSVRPRLHNVLDLLYRRNMPLKLLYFTLALWMPIRSWQKIGLRFYKNWENLHKLISHYTLKGLAVASRSATASMSVWCSASSDDTCHLREQLGVKLPDLPWPRSFYNYLLISGLDEKYKVLQSLYNTHIKIGVFLCANVNCYVRLLDLIVRNTGIPE